MRQTNENDTKIYYEEISNLWKYKLTLSDRFLDCMAAASDFALKHNDVKLKLKNTAVKTRNFKLFKEYFGLVKFALLEFEIASTLLKRDKGLTDKDARNEVADKYFDGPLLKNHYEIKIEAQKRLEEIFTETNQEYQEALNTLRGQGYDIKYFPSNVSAVYHYRKHGFEDQLSYSQPTLTFEQYLREAYDTIKAPTTINDDIYTLQTPSSTYFQQAILSKDQDGSSQNLTLTSYYRSYK
jgi:uncharacterized protein (UPF0335 family)